jgi:hypothetical protein
MCDSNNSGWIFVIELVAVSSNLAVCCVLEGAMDSGGTHPGEGIIPQFQRK